MTNLPWKDSLDLSMAVTLELMKSEGEMKKLRMLNIKYLAVPFEFYDLPDDEITFYFERLKAMGFVFETCHLPFGGGNRPHSVCAEDEAVRQAAIAMWQRYLTKFRLTGMRATPMHTGGAMNKAGGKKALERLTDSITRILPFAKEAGVVLALENTFFSNPCVFSDAPNPSGVSTQFINDDCKMLREYVLSWNEPLIRVCHDVGHSNLYGHNVKEDIELLHGLTALYHIQDNDGVSDLHYNVGQGTVDWSLLFASLERDQYPFPLYDEVLNDVEPIYKPFVRSLPERIGYLYAEAKNTLKRGIR